MFARVFKLQVSPDQMDQFVQPMQQTAPAIRESNGFRAGYLLVDRQAGEAMTVTLWDTEEDLRASSPSARQIISGALQAAGATPSEPKTYEVAIEL